MCSFCIKNALSLTSPKHAASSFSSAASPFVAGKRISSGASLDICFAGLLQSLFYWRLCVRLLAAPSIEFARLIMVFFYL